HVPHADLLVLTHRHLPADGWQFAGHSRGTGPGADVRLSVVRPVDGRLDEAPAPLVEAVDEVVDGVVREPPVQAELILFAVPESLTGVARQLRRGRVLSEELHALPLRRR